MQDVQSPNHIVVVLQRLAHTHKHDAESPRSRVALQDHDLRDDLSGREIADQPHLPREAERAAQRASDLRRYTEGVAVGARYQNGFRGLAVAELQQIASRSVGGIETPRNLRKLQVKRRREGFAPGERNRHDTVEIRDSVPVNRAKHTARARGAAHTRFEVFLRLVEETFHGISDVESSESS